MSPIAFPTQGQHFGVTFSNGIDRSYRDEILVCLASDQHRVVGKFVTEHWSKKPIVFYRGDWDFQGISDAVVEAIHFHEESAAQKEAA